MRTTINIRQMNLDDLEAYLSLSAESDKESGQDGDPYSGPYSRDEPFPTDVVRERNTERWVRPLSEPGWRRAWGAFVGDEMVGSASLIGGDLAADLHRVDLGMGILRRHRRKGGGDQLIRVLVDWTKKQSSIAWIDLGVFSDNLPAISLYQKHGFTTVGETADRWRVDGIRIGEIHMMLNVEA